MENRRRRISAKGKERSDVMKEAMEEGIFADLTIDKNNLDIEASIIGEKVRKFGLLLTRTKELRRRVATELEIVEFEQMVIIRKNLEQWGITKDTDATVMKAVKSTEEWQNVNKKLNSVRRKEEDYSIIVDALKSNGFMIRTLTDLWMNDYFSQEDSFDKKTTSRKLSTRHLTKE